MGVAVAGVAYLDFKSEIFLEVFYDHDKKRKFNSQSLAGISRASNVGGAVRRE